MDVPSLHAELSGRAEEAISDPSLGQGQLGWLFKGGYRYGACKGDIEVDTYIYIYICRGKCRGRCRARCRDIDSRAGCLKGLQSQFRYCLVV